MELLGVLCGLSLSPEVCILRSAKWFYKRGRATLLFAKFLPGVNTMAPPLAGSMHMRASQFLRFDFGGVLLYTVAYGALGYLFRDVFRIIAGGLQAFSRAVAWVMLIGVIGFVCYRAWLFARYRLNRSVRRVPVSDVEARLRVGRRAGHHHRGRAQPRLLRPGRRARPGFHPHRAEQSGRIHRDRCPRTRPFIFTALDYAKPPAPVWRTSCGKKDSMRTSSPVDCGPGAGPDIPWNRCPRKIWSCCRASIKTSLGAR